MENQKDFENFIFISGLENAVQFKGLANPKSLIGKVIGKFPSVKSNMAESILIINKIVDEINSLSLDEQIEKLKQLNPKSLEKKEKKILKKKDGLPKLENTQDGVVVRFEPAPSGYLHLGHIFPIIANYEIKKKFGGKFILRIGDTNPNNIDIKNYDRVIEDVKWLCDDDIDEIVYQSDRLEIYYKYLRQLVETANAYICKCSSEVFKAYTDASEKCPCNGEMDIEIQLKKYDKLFDGRYKMGEAVVRAKADVLNKNPALRSFPLARINTNSHARVGNKYSVWPNMHLSVPIDDNLMKLTHVIRGKDHEINTQRQKMVHKALNMKSPEYFHMGIFKFVDMNLSKSDLTKKIEEGEFSGWADPRVPSILAYRKRGYRAKAFRNFVLSLGISKRDSKITSAEYHKGLDFFNKQILEVEANRYFFVHNPKKITIRNLNKYDQKEIILPKHPTDKSKGTRHFKVETSYVIDSIDFNNLNIGDKLRLMHFANFKIIEKLDSEMIVDFISKDYDKNLSVKRNIHFVPTENKKVQITLQDNSKLNGVCEDLENIAENTNIQFERFGFVNFINFENGINNFYFTHK